MRRVNDYSMPTSSRSITGMSSPSTSAVATAPVVVLCSRGFSFEQRLDQVRQYAHRKGIQDLVLLHSPEDRYTEPLAAEVRARAQDAFRLLNEQERESGEQETRFSIILSEGKLYDNLRMLLAERRVDTVFVGMTMFDERINKLKDAETDIHFLGDPASLPRLLKV